MSTADKTKPTSSLKSKENGVPGYLSALAGGKSPISMPPIPAWMLNTPMYSKLPMIPAPKGKITLYTTGLGEKLYPTPSGLEFDPTAEGLISEYKSLHDPHLKSHYTQPASFHELIKKRFITPEGKVICTLKEFNEYHQYLKRVHIEKLDQDRKVVATKERDDRERQRQEWSHKEELSPHDKQVLETQTRKKKMLREQHRRLTQRLEEDAVRHMRLVEAMETKRSIEKARSNLEREKRRNKTLRLELEEHIKRVTKRVSLAEDESRHAELLKCYRMNVRERRHLKLDDQWNRHQRIREKRRTEEAEQQTDHQASVAQNIDVHEKSVYTRWAKQHSTFKYIRDTRAMSIHMQEAKIQARLEQKLKAVRKRFEQRHRTPAGGRRRRPPRHGLGGPRHHSTWPIEHVMDRIELSPADGVWKIDESRIAPICPSVPSPIPSPTAILEPTVTLRTKDILPSITTQVDAILEEVEEAEPTVAIQEDGELSSFELAALFGDQYDSFIATARDLVGNIMQALEVEKLSLDDTTKEPETVGSEVLTPQETELPEVMRRKSVLQLTNSTIARLVLSKVFCRAKEQISAEGGLPEIPTREVASDTAASVGPARSSITKQTSMREMHMQSPVAKSGVLSEELIQRQAESSPKHTSSSLLAAAVVSDALRNVTLELKREAQRSDTSILAEDVVWGTIRNVTDQLQKELSANVTRELIQESKRSDTSILAEDVVQDAIRNVTSELQKELTDSGTSLLAERVVTDAIRSAATQLREMPLGHSSTSLMAEELASNAIREATRQLQILLPQSSSSIIAEAIAADAMKNVMRQFGEQPPQTSSSILAQAFAADALKNAGRRLEHEQVLQALRPPAHSSSSLLAQAITNDTLQKVTRQLQREREALAPHTSSSLLAQAVTNNALANAARQLERRVSSPHTDSSLLAQVVTKEALQNAALQVQIQKCMKPPQTDSSILAQEITVGALQNAAAQITNDIPQLPLQTSSSRLAQVTVDDALQTVKDQLKTERASSRCRSRGSRSASPFSPVMAKSAVNQASPEPTQSKAKPRAVASDIIKRETPCQESPSPTKDDYKTPPSSPDCPIAEPTGSQIDGIPCQAQVVVMHAVEGALANLIPDVLVEECRDECNIEHRSSIFLATVNDVFPESELDAPAHSPCAAGESEDDNSDEESEVGEIIGVVENEIIAEEESVHSLAECLEGSRTEGLTTVVKKSHDKTIFEGAVIPHDKTHESVTEKVLSVEDLFKDRSGHLVHDVSGTSLHKVSESGESAKDAIRETSQHYSTIVPVYQTHTLNVDEELIAHNLSAISMKPDSKHKVPSAYSASSRNSFRNMFRPDMTHCQGSAKCLKNTLVRELSHSQDGVEHEHVYGVLDQPHEDIGAHHSDEELVELEETGGVCYLPKRTTYKAHEVLGDVVVEEQEPNENADDGDALETSQDSKDVPAGGDFQSPVEEEVEPALPVPRSSNKSLRSAKSRDIQQLHSKAVSGDKIPPPSSAGGPSQVASTAEAITITDTPSATKAASSRSLIGAVIDRLSSIFSRKHSTKIHPGPSAAEEQDQESTKTHQEPSGETDSHDHQSKSEVVDSIPAADNTGPSDDAVPKSKPVDDKEIPAERAVTLRDSSPTATQVGLKNQRMEDGLEDVTMVKPQADDQAEKPNAETVSEQVVPDGELREEHQKTEALQCSSDQPKGTEYSADKQVMDEQHAVDKQESGTERKLDEKETPKKESQVVMDVREQSPTKQPPELDAQKLPTEAVKGKDFDRAGKSDRKVLKSDSDSVLRVKTSKIETPKHCASMSTTLSRPGKASPDATSSKRPQVQPSKTPSPKPRVSISSPHSSKTPTRLVSSRLSTHSCQQRAPAAAKSASVGKASIGSSMPTVGRQRSQVSKPQSSGSVRVINVNPAPSMSSTRRRSSSVEKLISGKVSGGSVRLINVSPAASTTISLRRSSGHANKVRSSSGTRAKDSASFTCSTHASKTQSEKCSPRQASCSSVEGDRGKEGVTAALPLSQKEGDGRQSPALKVEEEQSSPRATATIESQTGILPPTDKPSEPHEPPDVRKVPSPQDLVKREPEDSIQSPTHPDKSPDTCIPQEETKKESGEEEQKPAQGKFKETTESDKKEAASAGTDPQSQSDANQSQVQTAKSPRDEIDQQVDEDPVSTPGGDTQPDRSPSGSKHSQVSQGATAGRRSKSLVSAVIGRLGRIFSGEARAGRSKTEGKYQSEIEMTVRERETKQGRGGRDPRQCQSTGAVHLPQTTLSAVGQEKKLDSEARLKKRKPSKTSLKGTKSSETSTKANRRDSGASLPVLPKTVASDSSSRAGIPSLPGSTGQLATRHSQGSSRTSSCTTQDALPPVEDVEAPGPETPPTTGKTAASPEFLKQ